MNEQEQKAYAEEKAEKILDKVVYGSMSIGKNLSWLKDFILSIIKDCQPKVSRELIKKHAVHMSINTYYDADDQKQGKTPMFERPRVENALIKFVEEAGMEVTK